MPRDDLFKLAARDIADMLHSDSHIPVGESLALLAWALREDDRLPNYDEKDELVTGGEDGEVDPAVVRKFPNTHNALNSFF